MSALGQKATCAPQNAMSALPPMATSIAFFGMSALGHLLRTSKRGYPAAKGGASKSLEADARRPGSQVNRKSRRSPRREEASETMPRHQLRRKASSSAL